MLRRPRHRCLNRRRHGRGRQHGIRARRIDNLRYAEFLVIVFALGFLQAFGCLQSATGARQSQRAQTVAQQPPKISPPVYGNHMSASIYTAKIRLPAKAYQNIPNSLSSKSLFVRMAAYRWPRPPVRQPAGVRPALFLPRPNQMLSCF